MSSTSTIGVALGRVKRCIEACRGTRNGAVRLVAVSKKKPVECIREAYEHGQRAFGENYVKELLEKAPLLPQDIQWHFIGHLQSNKCKQLLSVENLAVVESVDSRKLARKLDEVCVELDRRLDVFVQVNTSGELSKSGVVPSECVELSQYILQECNNLYLRGLMTIGQLSEEPSAECFEILKQCREHVSAALHLSTDSLQLSMGMSNDFELAIQHGSTNVRVGSLIFGSRP